MLKLLHYDVCYYMIMFFLIHHVFNLYIFFTCILQLTFNLSRMPMHTTRCLLVNSYLMISNNLSEWIVSLSRNRLTVTVSLWIGGSKNSALWLGFCFNTYESIYISKARSFLHIMA